MEIQIISDKVESISGYAEVVLQQILPDGTTIYSSLILKKDTDGFWKIKDEVMPE
jgi:hypothetical protein